uniref:F-box domain-containing protein n=1 Tax=Bionectria ochroleuca TaxID=29856 RepID=A0A8H7K922_BIOOC
MAFLELPTELRQRILDFAICSRQTPPESPSASQRDRSNPRDGFWYDYCIWQLPPKNLALPLMLVSRQFCADVQKVLQLFGTNYHVDIMFVKDCGFWTTWSIPALPRTQYIDSVHATFRIFEPTQDLDEKFKDSLCLNAYDEGSSGGILGFHLLLAALLRSGPGFLEPSSNAFDPSSPYAIKRILIDVLSPTDVVEHSSIIASNEEFHTNHLDRARVLKDHLHDVQIAPDTRLAEHVLWGFRMLWDLNSESLEYGAIVLEGVRDTIDFMVNGELHTSFDVAERVKTMQMPVHPWTEPPAYALRRETGYRKWRKWLDERRKLMDQGLVFDPKRPVQVIYL